MLLGKGVAGHADRGGATAHGDRRDLAAANESGPSAGQGRGGDGDGCGRGVVGGGHGGRTLLLVKVEWDSGHLEINEKGVVVAREKYKELSVSLGWSLSLSLLLVRFMYSVQNV